VGEAIVVPMSTSVPQPITRSAGVIDGAALDALDALAADRATRDIAVVVAQHHPPHPHRMPVANWVDGLQNHARARHVIGRHRHVHVLCGHTHRASDRSVGEELLPRVFCTTAVVDHASPVRIYEVQRGRLIPTEPATGSTAHVPVLPPSNDALPAWGAATRAG
jgi:3',5'-cyclic AMP phosphodiesterase CpdA